MLDAGTMQAVPDIDDESYAALKRDVERHGVLVPVEVDDEGRILDGFARARAAAELGIDFPRLIRIGMTADEKVSHRMRLNALRRHMTKEEFRSFVYWMIENDPTASNRRIAAATGIEHHTVAEMRDDLVELGKIPQLDERVGADGKSRRMPVYAKSEASERKCLEQLSELRSSAPDLYEDVSIGSSLNVATMKMVARSCRDAPPLAGTYSVIYCDPPWQFSVPFADTRGASGKYPTMNGEELSAVPVEEIASENSVVFMWSPPSHLPEALELMVAWGFKYRTGFVWHKHSGMNGRYNYIEHENLLFGMKGTMIPECSTWHSVLRPDCGPLRHSEKPAEARHMIECMYPNQSRIELFARERHDGWDAWGNQISSTT